MSVPLALLRASALDLRANLEAKLRCLTAIEMSLNRYVDEGGREPLQELVGHLAAIHELHQVSTEIIQVASSGLEQLLGHADEVLPN